MSRKPYNLSPFKDFKKSLENQKVTYVALDTEFTRRTTYWPILELVQLKTDQQSFLLDAKDDHFSILSFSALFTQPDCLTIVHSGRQDIEIFFHTLNILPNNLFDTQLAACVCGYGESCSYSDLVEKLLSTKLDKSQQDKDWSVRPFSKEQLSYAMDDVTYLYPLYEVLQKELIEKNRLDLFYELMERFYHPENLVQDISTAWERFLPSFKSQGLRVKKHLKRFRALITLRESLAQNENKLRKSVLSDQSILKICRIQTFTPEEIEKRLQESEKERAPLIFESFKKLPKLIKEKTTTINQQELSPLYQEAFSFISTQLSLVAKELNIPKKWLANNEDVYQAALWFSLPSDQDLNSKRWVWSYMDLKHMKQSFQDQPKNDEA